MEDKVFCSDILDALTQDFFARKGNPIEEPAHVEEIKVSDDTIVLTFFLPGDNVCGSSWVRANLVIIVETARGILRIAHTEGLEGLMIIINLLKSLKCNNCPADFHLSWFAGAQKQSHRCDSEQGEPQFFLLEVELLLLLRRRSR